MFPWAGDPSGSSADRERIVGDVALLRRCVDLVAGRPGVDAGRIGVVGHDFGGMHAIVLGTADRRPAAYVLIAAVPRWADWFLPFWDIPEDRIDYLRAMRPLDPIEHIGRVAPARVQLQFGRRDFFIAPMTGLELKAAAPEGTELKAYDAEHDMAADEIQSDRTAFLEAALGV
jgi:pimeloyl-ACP methyl ester carboxylesterase